MKPFEVSHKASQTHLEIAISDELTEWINNFDDDKPVSPIPLILSKPFLQCRLELFINRLTHFVKFALIACLHSLKTLVNYCSHTVKTRLIRLRQIIDCLRVQQKQILNSVLSFLGEPIYGEIWPDIRVTENGIELEIDVRM